LRPFKIILLTLISYFILFQGCSNKSSDKSNLQNGNSSKQYNKPQVNIITAAELKNIIDNRYGKILFINVWAAWSKPSIKELPDIDMLYNNYRYKDVDFLSLSVDLTSKIDSVVIPFLQKEKFEHPVYVVQEKSGIQIMKMLSPKWNGGIPASFLFDKNGKREIFILGSQSYANFCKGIDSVRVLR
jgi:thiol-disulfide isomerase/thioredoxin